MPEPRKIGEKTPEYTTAELGRALPRLLDSERADGGVMRLLTEPGGRIDQASIAAASDAGVGVEFTAEAAIDRLKLLIQQPAELDDDFLARAAMAPFRSAYWDACRNLASKPYEQPVVPEGQVPVQLVPGGEWEQDVDGQGNDVRTFLRAHSRDSVGYGWGSILTERREDRPVWRWVGPESITAVEAENKRLSGPSVVEIVGSEGGEDVLLRLRSAEHAGTDFAVGELYLKEASGYAEQPSAIRQMDPHVEIPLDPLPAQILSPTWFALPLLLPAAKLDHLLAQVSSQLAYGVSQVLTFLRFAKGLNEDDVERWAEVGPKIFYATTSQAADMKWVVLSADAIQAGTLYEDHLLRGIEVAGLAPMLTRMPGDEKATGIAISSARAKSGAESIAQMFQSHASSAYTRLARYTPASPDLRLKLYTDFGASLSSMAAAEMKAKIYLDPKGGMERPEFWAAMIEHGIVTEAVDVKDLTEWAERANPEVAKLKIERANALLRACSQGLLIGSDVGREAVLRSLIDFGVISAAAIQDGQDLDAFVRTLQEGEAAAGWLMPAGFERLSDLDKPPEET